MFSSAVQVWLTNSTLLSNLEFIIIIVTKTKYVLYSNTAISPTCLVSIAIMFYYGQLLSHSTVAVY